MDDPQSQPLIEGPKPEKKARVARARVRRAPAPENVEALNAPKTKYTGRFYYEAVGRRKEAIARVRLYSSGSGSVTVGSHPMATRFGTPELQELILSPLRAIGQDQTLDVSARASGGGLKGQAEAIRLGIARALLKLNPIFRKALKKEGYLKRDPRVKERKKYGLKRARRAPQFSKR